MELVGKELRKYNEAGLTYLRADTTAGGIMSRSRILFVQLRKKWLCCQSSVGMRGDSLLKVFHVKILLLEKYKGVFKTMRT